MRWCPVKSRSPSWFLLPLPAPREAGGVHAAPLAGVPVEVFQGPGLSLPQGLPLPRRRSRLPPALGARRSPASHELCTGKSFIFLSLPGMYCHLIFMYAILPDKYDLLPGNSSDVHSVPCSNYGSVPAAAAGAAEPLLHLSAGSGLPDALSCQSAASKYNQREK